MLSVCFGRRGGSQWRERPGSHRCRRLRSSRSVHRPRVHVRCGLAARAQAVPSDASAAHIGVRCLRCGCSARRAAAISPPTSCTPVIAGAARQTASYAYSASTLRPPKRSCTSSRPWWWIRLAAMEERWPPAQYTTRRSVAGISSRRRASSGDGMCSQPASALTDVAHAQGQRRSRGLEVPAQVLRREA